MIRQCFPALAEEPPVLVDWLPWNHTFGGNHNVGIVALQRRHALHRRRQADAGADRRDAAQPARDRADDLLQRAEGLRGDRQRAGGRRGAAQDAASAACRMFFFSGAGLVAAGLGQARPPRRAAECGERIVMLTGLGMTETAPFAICANAHEVQVGPHRPAGARASSSSWCRAATSTEVRYRGPNVTPGYWRAPEQTAEAFDDEGFYCTGDAVKPMDPARPRAAACMFDGRIAEDFKLATGTFVSRRPAAREDHRRRRSDRAGRRHRRHQPQRDRRR